VPDRRGDEGGRDEEAGRVQPEHLDGAEARHEESRERRADEDGAAVDPLADPGRPLDPHVRELGDVGEQRAAGGRAGRVEERAEEDERVERGQRERVERVEERDRGHGGGAREVGDHARRTEAEPVDERAAEEAGHDRRQEGEEADEAGERRPSRLLEHEPRDGHERADVADERDRVGREERVERPTRQSFSSGA
jgi:hypothetical protein